MLEDLAFDASPAGVLLVDEESRIVRVNQVAAKIFGYNVDELLTKPVSMLLPEDIRERHGHLVQRYFHSPTDRLMGFSEQRVLKGLHRSGAELHLQLGLNLRHKNGKPYVIVAIVDQSEVHQLNAQLQQSNARLREQHEEINELYNVQSHLLHVVSHELKTPLHSLLGITQVVRDQIEPTQAIATLLNDMDVASRMAVRTLRTLTDLSDCLAGKLHLNLERFNVVEMIRERIGVLAHHYHLGSDDVQYCFDTDGEPIVEADRIRLRRIFFGLVSNALTHAHAKHITVNIICRSQSNEPYLMVEVIDDGVGVEKDILDNIHLPMANAAQRVKRGAGGLGVDLYLHQQYLQAMGGKFWLDSELGHGTHAGFRVPLKVLRLRNDKGGLPDRSHRLKGCRILLAEDEKIVARVTKIQLEKLGAVVVVAENGRIALERAADTSEGRFHLILMDLDMPEMNGYEATRAIRCIPEYQYVPIYAVTAGLEKDAFPKAIRAGMDKCFSKPFNPEYLLDTLQLLDPSHRPPGDLSCLV